MQRATRHLRQVISAVLVLGALLVVVDYAVAALAESGVSRQLREQIGLVDDPGVLINGFPFLTQAVTGTYASIDLTAPRLAVGPFRELELDAHLEDVSAPLSGLLGAGPATIRVTRALTTIRVSARDLGHALPGVAKTRVETVDRAALQQLVDAGADPTLTQLDPATLAHIIATIPAPSGGPVDVAVIVSLGLPGDTATLTPRDIRLRDGTPWPAPGNPQRVVLARFARSLDIGKLPFHAHPQKFGATNGMLEIAGTAAAFTMGAVPTSATG